MKKIKRHMKPTAFLRKYGKVIIGGVILSAILFCSICAPMLTEWDPEQIKTADAKMLPSAEHIMGTDSYGRDVFSRVLFGSRSTLLVAIGAQLLSTVVGTILGLLCGYYSKMGKFLMRILDAFATIPNLLLCLLMVSVMGAGVLNLIAAMSVQGIPGLARMVRNQVLSLREKEFIESEKAMGASDRRTITLHILPSCFSFLLVRFSNGLSGSILTMTSLSYLGIGLDPTIASWGGMIQDGQKVMFALPYMVLYPALAISVTVFAFSILGDGLRDILDPKLR